MLTTLAQNNAAGMGIFAFIMLIYLAILLAIIIGGWKMFAKAGQPGWAILIPIFNAYIFCKLVGRPGWWVVLMFIPIVSLIVSVILSIDLAKSFGRGGGFAVGIFFLGFIFIPILGFGKSEYQGPSASIAGV
jgi:uncharacterized membrane protein YhaH (DUF805 family)